MQPGDEWVYRLRDEAPTERVLIISVTSKGNWIRADVEFLDDEHPRRVENVPANRLHVPWSEMHEFDTRMAHIERLWEEPISDIEAYASHQVLDLLVSTDVAEETWKPVRHALAVYDPDQLSALMGVPLETVQDNVAWFQDDSIRRLSPEGTAQVCAALCRTRPEPVLKHLLDDEERIRILCATGYTGERRAGQFIYEDPDFAWESYLEIERPMHELMRQWCGYRAVTSAERLEAAEREIHRLDRLLEEAIKELGAGAPDHATEYFRTLQVRDRITAADVRPVVAKRVEPPLPTSSRRRGRWW